MSELYLPAGAGAGGPYDLEVTPASAGWGYSSLRTISLAAGESHEFGCDGEEIIVVPLSGSATVSTGEQSFILIGRPHVFAGPTDIVYLPAGSTATLTSTGGGRYALCGAVSTADCRRTTRRRPGSRWNCAVPVSPAARCGTSARPTRSGPARSSPAR